MQETLTIQGLRLRWTVSHESITRWVSVGLLAKPVETDGKVRFKLSSIERFERRGGVQAGRECDRAARERDRMQARGKAGVAMTGGWLPAEQGDDE